MSVARAMWRWMRQAPENAMFAAMCIVALGPVVAIFKIMWLGD